MRKELIFVILLSLLPFIFIFSTTSFFYTQDGWTHLARGGAFYKALQDGQWPVRWAGDLNYGFGMPLFNYVFHMPYMVMSLFIFMGTGLVTALKITFLISFLFSGIFMYLFAKEFFKDKQKALLVTVFYQFFPYHLVDLLVRGSIGESFAFTFLPLVLYGSVLLFKNFSLKAFAIVAFATAGIMLSHLATGAVFLAISGVFILLFVEKIKKAITPFVAMVVGLGLSAYYWMPAVIDHKYTFGSFFAKDLYAANFVPFFNFFSPNFFNNPTLRMGDVPIPIGLFHSIGLLLALWILFVVRKTKSFDKKLIIFCLVIIVSSLFIMQPVSRFIWEHVPLFEQFQFPWRFLGAVGFATSLLAIYFLSIPLIKRYVVFFLLVFLVIGTTAWYWYPQLGFRMIKEEDYWNYPLDTTYFGETNLVWSAGSASSYPKATVEVIDGEAVITPMERKSNLHIYRIDAKEPTRLVDRTQFFPGWKVFVDGESVPIQFQDPAYRGEITYEVSKGQHDVKVLFGETKMRIIADVITVMSLLFLVVLTLLGTYKKKRLKRQV